MQEIKDFQKDLSNQCFDVLKETTSFNYRALTLYPKLYDIVRISEGWFLNLKNYYELNLFEE